ncbi:MAG: hypothetical protein QM655_00340 [Nocardioidaceae bacterium]
MSTRPTSALLGRRRAALLVALCLLSAAALAAVLTPRHDDRGRGTADLSAENPALPTKARVLTLDLSGKRATKKIRAATKLVTSTGATLVAFQGMRPAQHQAFKATLAQTWGTYPGLSRWTSATKSTIAWRTDTWALAEGHLLTSVGAKGATVRRPYVVLRNTRTGKLLTVLNTDHPADPATRAATSQSSYRAAATGDDLSLLDELLGTGPVLYTVGVNASPPRSYYCKVTAKLAMHSANGGAKGPRARTSTCQPPKSQPDQVYASNGVKFSGLRQLTTPLARSASDTAPVLVTSTIPAPSFPRFRVASFNLLGANHTDGKRPERKGWASSARRTAWAVRLIRRNSLSVVGLQEFQNTQRAKFTKLMGTRWAMYPGNELPGPPAQNSIVWKTADWTVLSKNTIDIPYFYGKPWAMPYVLLQNNATGEQVWFANFHNPASSKKRGNHAKWRAKATAREVALAKQLTADGTALVMTGDMNDRAANFCVVTKSTLYAAAGGSRGNVPCVLPAAAGIDWIYGSYDVPFSGYTKLRNALVKKTSDHPLIWADAAVVPTPVYAIRSRLTSISLAGKNGLDRVAPAVRLIGNVGTDLVTFRGVDATEFTALRKRLGSGWATYPAASTDNSGDTAVNETGLTSTAIAWRTSSWALVQGAVVNLPHSNGTTTSRPYVLLRHRATGRQVYVANFENAPDTVVSGQTVSQATARSAAVAAEQQLLAGLVESGNPVWAVVGANDPTPGPSYCSLLDQLPVTASVGGSSGPLSGRTCSVPPGLGKVMILADNGTTAGNPTTLTSSLARTVSPAGALLTDLYVPPAP